jgi:hypothetical protein
MTAIVAALFVSPKGPYWADPRCDCWDEARDARNYSGPLPVVAHPPCQLWINYAALNFKRYGGEHNRPGNDGGCFASAIKSVRIWGGVLEHPAFSNAWKRYGLQRPERDRIGWIYVGNGPSWLKHYVCEVWQSAYGHRARKRTWIYYVGANAPAELNWQRNAGTHQCGWFDRVKPTLGKAVPPERPKPLPTY